MFSVLSRPQCAVRPLALALSLLTIAAHAEVTQLEDVVVTATREVTPIAKAPISIGKINQQTLQDIKPTFIGQVVNRVPGVVMTDLGNEQHNMSIRQPMTYAAVYQYLEDGIPIRPVGIFNHNALYEINLPGADGIEVVRGPASSLYGSNAVGGAINFTTAAPPAGPLFTLGAQFSNEGYRRADIAAGNTWGDTGIRLSGYQAARRDSWQDHNEMDKTGLTLRGDHWLNESLLWKSTLTYSKLDTEMPGSLNATDFNTRPGFSYNTFTYREVDALRATTGIEGELNAGGKTSATVYYRDNTTNQLPSYLIFNTGPKTASGRTTDNSFTSLGATAFHRQQWDALKLTVGGLIETSPQDAREQNLSIVRDPVSGKYLSYTKGSIRRDYSVDLSNQAVYGDASYALGGGWGINAGLRYDRVVYDFTNYLKPSPTTGGASQEQSFSNASPKAGLTWQAAPDLFFYSGYSVGFTPPEVGSLFSSAITPNLKPATFDQFELGLRSQPIPGLKLDAVVYRLDGEDELVNFTTQPGKSEPRNAGKTRHEGVELGLNWTANSAWSMNLAGQYAKHIYREYKPSPTLNFSGNDIPAAPTWQGQVELVYRPIEALRLGFETSYLGKYWMDESNKVEYGGHTLVNLRAQYRLKQFTLWASVNNLLDKHYSEMSASSYKGQGPRNPDAQDTYNPGAPRTFLVGASWAFGDGGRDGSRDGKGAQQ
ncbi:TonB-dependent receptor [Deefgea tanakiae]|uniref:TonB-dependent receptor n=1 Tax=Deefgea tanakiae TaxID=2865840 RepID=A0ABX8Z7I7_9NEIS|nr:TonB-dependent receptor [Deefgea tanakiae]QZA78521.1 TonB-dependent receptor [Deefgea tanakiae]